ncbi:MAG: glycoside hydrolase family 2 TIM barrel-domain containing protein [Bacteroides sp.]
MKQLIYTLFLCMAFASCSSSEEQAERRQLFTDDWRFCLGDDTLAAHTDYDDSAWRQLNLPHDWAIEGDFSQDNPSGTGGGALPGGVGWYRKSFTPAKADADKQFYIDFDGAYMNASVYLNGHLLGTRPYGYISFSYDLTPYLQWGKKNVLAVRVDNAEQPNSRWYSGCGIYRNVWLRRVHPIHLAQWGTFIQTEAVEGDVARLTLTAEVENMDRSGEALTLKAELIDADGVVVAQAENALSASPVALQLTVASPRLWSVASPYLYTVRTTLSLASGRVLDSEDTPFGIRTFHFDVAKGFSLNGEPMKLNGVCLHHDLGCLGAAVNRRAIERQLEILREMGCNSIRCSHNPPSPELLDLCDRMGFIVMDEAFDMWRKKKTRHDYARYFNEWHERDLHDLIVRDRNHPSICIWSIGNEVLEQWSDANADTLSLEEANMILNFGHSAAMLAKEEGELSVNSLLTRKLADFVRQFDASRPITAGCNEPNPGNHLFRSGALDLIGFNYHDDWFADVPKNFPGKPFIITESVSGLMTRGYYRMPSDVSIICPERWDKPYYDPTFSCSSYDNCRVPWGNHHEGTLRHVENNDFISGQYIWTGFDYIGEPTPYGWPARSSYFGVIDLAGFPKDVYYMYQSVWRPDKQVLHLFPHWNWKEGEEVDLWAYYNNADQVELFVNGRSQGVRTKQPAGWQPGSPATKPVLQGSTDYHVQWRVKYEPGVVKAVARKEGRVVAEQEIHTAGQPAAIRLTPDRTQITADGRDLSFITVEVTDADGNLCPWAEDDIRFAVTGGGFIAGVDNGSPISMERFKADHRRAFYGKCLVVVQSNGESSPIRVKAEADGLAAAEVQLKIKN